MRKTFLVFIFFLTALWSAHAQRLGRFTMSKFAAGGQNNIAYPMQKSFFGKLPSNSIMGYVQNDTTFYFMYLWLPTPVKELGLQLISPVPQFSSAWKGDYEAADYHDSLKAEGKYFDPNLEVSFCRFMESDLLEDTTRNRLLARLEGRNDNSSEAPVQPSMKRNNSLIRLGVTETDTSYVAAGLYTLTIRSSNGEKPEGTFVLQIGVTEIVPGLKLFWKPDEFLDRLVTGEHK